jgi:hypothetical protein
MVTSGYLGLPPPTGEELHSVRKYSEQFTYIVACLYKRSPPNAVVI